MSSATEHRNAKAAEAAINNEHVTRQRVDHLEAYAGTTSAMFDALMDDIKRVDQQQLAFSTCGLIGRIKWLLFGDMPDMPDDTNDHALHSSEAS